LTCKGSVVRVHYLPPDFDPVFCKTGFFVKGEN
jgi:hypothetical protein